MKETNKPKGYGAYTPDKIKEIFTNVCMVEIDGLWYPARPEPYKSFIERIRYAWDILTYKAEPLYWYFKKGYKRTSKGFEIE
ncbi:hypothetical protein E6Q11_04285 [Candidatus Dojkabacteria bacterium]|uniref:Uncharacterized protein n=1 Tax=Candidatus Dojkabacteria bacterium TaxID=2099670 RepID=A0A5C7J4Y6_9BACT|nr:MAG: hypothetical protein E6Q11_04285 [Candidatus Dojkabacteria bacterium]